MLCGAALLSVQTSWALVPMLDGGKQMPKIYDGWMNEQIAKQASTGIANALAAGYDKIEVQFPPVPNLDEVRVVLLLLDIFLFCLYVCFSFVPNQSVCSRIISSCFAVQKKTL